ncbi:lysoplasmalogenase TMEM86B-like [Petaurus breviceps papuanus]|uniref:lysoplasmalogenase TMEM86B-like n=1 Tax=Petaurus breviceps papuanus TaxID=3040969 RepID=UPI0036D90AE3
MEAGGRESERRHTPEPLPHWRLVPFFASCAFYLLFWLPSEEPSWTSALVKCFPNLFLAFFVRNTAPAGLYGQFIWLGLLCSILGDIIVTWPNRFLFGMLFFALSHLFHLRALGWFPICQTFLESVAVVFFLYLGILHSHLPACLNLPVAVYAVILTLMLWRALVRGRYVALAGLFFSISDALHAWNTFIRPLPLGRLMIMGTYYTAQAMLALSTVEGRAPQAG